MVLEDPNKSRKVTKEVLKAGAVETALNTFGILRDLAGDFQRQDAFFKYKVLVLALWAILCTTSVTIGCPGGGVTNDIGARLVVAGEATRPIYMVKNDTASKWTDVEITVNGQWRTTAAEIGANGDVTLVPKLLINPSGESAPNDLKVNEIFVRSAEGEALLMRGGRVME